MSAAKSAKAATRNLAPGAGAGPTARARIVGTSPGRVTEPAKTLRAVLRSLLAVLLIWAGLSKLGDPVSTYTALLDYQLPTPKLFLKFVAVVLPWLELLCGLMLLANFYRRAATLVTTALFGVFLVMAAQAVVRGLDISCGCFNLGILGIQEASAAARFLESVGFAFARNLLLLAGAIYLLRTERVLPSAEQDASGKRG